MTQPTTEELERICWGYDAGRASRDAEVAELREKADLLQGELDRERIRANAHYAEFKAAKAENERLRIVVHELAAESDCHAGIDGGCGACLACDPDWWIDHRLTTPPAPIEPTSGEGSGER